MESASAKQPSSSRRQSWSSGLGKLKLKAVIAWEPSSKPPMGAKMRLVKLSLTVEKGQSGKMTERKM